MQLEECPLWRNMPKHLIVLLHRIVGFNYTSYSKGGYFMQSHYHLMHIENSRQIKYLKFHLEHIQAYHYDIHKAIILCDFVVLK